MALADAAVESLFGWLGGQAAKKDRKRAAELEDEALGMYDGVDAPTLERINQERLGTEGWTGLPTDYGNLDARDAAIRQLMQVGEEGGMDPGSRLALEQARQASALQDAQQRQAISQGMARRGLGGAGEAAMQTFAQQQGNNRLATEGLQAAADARARALQALAQGGAMAERAEDADFGRAATRQTAIDRINQFNAANNMDAQRFNAGQQQQQWQNTLGLTDRRVAARQHGANVYGQRGDAKAAQWTAAGGAIGGGMRDAEQTALSGLSNPMMMQAGGASGPSGQSQVYDPNDPRRRRY